MKDQLRGSREVEILMRIFKPDEANLNAEAAQAILQLRIDPQDRERMHELTVKNQEDTLSEEERAELENYCHVGRFLDLLASKARRSLRKLGVKG